MRKVLNRVYEYRELGTRHLILMYVLVYIPNDSTETVFFFKAGKYI